MKAGEVFSPAGAAFAIIFFRAPRIYKKISHERIMRYLFRPGEEGLEPPSTVLETAALPLNYSPICQYSIMTDNFYSLSRFAVFVNIFLPIFMPDFYVAFYV